MTETEVASLYRDHGYMVFRRCVLFLGDAVAAQDAVHEVFVRVVRAEEEFRSDPKPRTWLCRVADRLCLDRLERGHTAPADLTFDEALGDVVDDDRDSLIAVRQLLERLDFEDWRLAVLHYVDELTEEELAKELGLSIRAIGKRIAHLHEQTRAVLQVENAS